MSQCKIRSVSRCAFIAAASLLAGVFAAQAASVPYSAGGTDPTLWNDGDNWTGGVKPGTGDTANFVSTSIANVGMVIDTQTDQTMQGLLYGDGTSFVRNFSINNNALTLNGSVTGTTGATVIKTQSNLLTGAPAGEVGTYDVNSNLIFNVPSTTTTAVRFVLSSVNAQLNLNGVLSMATGSRAGLRIEGGGAVALTNTGNSYTGATTIAVGNLIAGGNDPASASLTGVFGKNTNQLVLGINVTTTTNNIALLTNGPHTIARNVKVAFPVAGYVGIQTIGGTTTQTVGSTFSGVITLDNSVQLRSNTTGAEVIAFSGQLTGAGGITKAGPGRVRVSSTTNNYIGLTTVSAGILELGNSNVVPDASGVVLNGGTIQTNGNSEVAGIGTLSNNSAIDFGGAGTVRLADSSAATWVAGKVLQLLNWNGSSQGSGATQFYIGTSLSLSESQLSQIQFVDPVGFDAGTYSAQQLSTGEVVVPEPAGLALIALALPFMRRPRRTR